MTVRQLLLLSVLGAPLAVVRTTVLTSLGLRMWLLTLGVVLMISVMFPLVNLPMCLVPIAEAMMAPLVSLLRLNLLSLRIGVIMAAVRDKVCCSMKCAYRLISVVGIMCGGP